MTKAPDIKKRIEELAEELEMEHVFASRVFCFRSYRSSSRARARIWSLPRIWQQALGEAPAYCCEVLSEKFDSLSEDDKDEILIHELLHIPKNFSGALVPHFRRRRGLERKLAGFLKKKRNGKD